MSTSSLFAGKLVRLAAPLPEDAEIIAYWSRDDEYCRQVDTAAARPLSPQQANEFNTSMIASPNGYLFHLRTLDDDRLIGFVAIHSIEWNNQAGTFATGIWDPEYRGKGYGREAIRLALNYAFNELTLYRLGLDVIADNPRAIRCQGSP
jgi:RimJ/RimL family protein N-acetyltransferase